MYNFSNRSDRNNVSLKNEDQKLKKSLNLKKRNELKDHLVEDNEPNSIENLFNNIVGYEDVKKIFYFAFNSSNPVHILLVGPPGSAKTLFLTECMKLERSYFTLGSHSTKAGMIDYLFNNRPKNLIIDELEYMSIKDQAALLSLMETGILSETKFEKTRTTVMKTRIFASCNNEKKLLTPLLSRFLVLHFKKYDYNVFETIANHILMKECDLDRETTSLISNLVWNKLKSRDIRDCIKIGRLCTKKDDVHLVINTLMSYS